MRGRRSRQGDQDPRSEHLDHPEHVDGGKVTNMIGGSRGLSILALSLRKVIQMLMVSASSILVLGGARWT